MKFKNNISIYSRFQERLILLDRRIKTLIVVFTDFFLLLISFWLSLSIRDNSFYYPSQESLLLICIGPFIAIPIFYFFGLYRSIIRYTSLLSIMTIVIAVSIYTVLWFILVVLAGIVQKPYDFLVINWLVSIFFIGGIRYFARFILSQKIAESKRVIIYGAGSAGLQLLSALDYDPKVKTICFVDDDSEYNGKYIEGIKVFQPTDLENLITKERISELLIAMPSAPNSKIRFIIESYKHLGIIIRKLPGINDLASGKVSVSDLKRINIEDLLKREVREPISDLLKKDILNKNVLITGAGGSIGSEICRQVIRQEPNLLILFEISEHSLYKIEKELLEIKSDIQIIAVLGDVTNKQGLESILDKYSVHTIYHSAAYKHVPMVEKNILAGLKCNVFGTLACIEAAINTGVQSFIFISTDKAVRPTNIMGSTKRFAELILQGIAKENSITKNNSIRISIVRFGNVLGSSGSVVPLFREQIEKGGPLTVTDPNIIRYFMTIKEAAQLVIQAGAMGKFGEIFVLDMGEQVQVLDLAKDMIRLSGMSVLDENNPEGDIEIVFTGLRPGEKLYEELLVDHKSEKTQHEKIMLARDNVIIWDELRAHIQRLETAIDKEDQSIVNEVFSQVVEGFNLRKQL